MSGINKDSNPKKIFVVFKTHFDIGFTELVSELVHRWNESMFPSVANVCETTKSWGEKRRYTWTMPSWPLYRFLNGLAEDPALAAKIDGLVRDEQIRWHGLPFTTYTEFCGLEEYIRGLNFAHRLTAKYGRRAVSAKMTDVIGHTWILPSILAKDGIKFLHLGPNQACKLPEVPGLFFWEGPDGGKVLTFYNKQGGYGSSLLPPDDWPFPVWLALIQTNDNAGPQQAEDIRYILEAVERDAPGTEVVIGGMDDFYDALSQYSLDDIPVVKTDIADTWIHGVGTMPREVARLRELRGTIQDAEKAVNLLGLLAPGIADVTSAGQIGLAYEQSLLFGEHTWGLTTFGVSYISYQRYYNKVDLHKNGDIERYEASWDEHRAYVRGAEEALSHVYPHALNQLAALVKTDGERLLFFNGLGWKRSAWVEIGAESANRTGAALIDAVSGEVLETARINGRLCAFVRDIPALGYRTAKLSDVPQTREKPRVSSVTADAGLGLLENTFFRITADAAAGTIASLIEKSSGREWVGKHDGRGFAQYQYDVYGEADATRFLLDATSRFYDWQVDSLVRKDYFGLDPLTAFPGGFTVTASREERSASLTLSADIADRSVIDHGNAAGIETTFTLYDDSPFIDIAYALKGKGKTFRVESGNFVFPVNIPKDKAEYRINKMGSVVNPRIDIVEGGNHALFCCENWVDVSDGERGLAFIPFDTPLFSIGSSGILKVRRIFDEGKPVLMFNAFNNSYGCDFPMWMDGDYAFRFRLVPHAGGWREGEIQRRAFESVMPPLVGYAREKDESGALPPVFSQGDFPEGMQVMALKKAEDKDGYILRLREINGEARRIKLTLDGTFGLAWVCDLTERTSGEPFTRAGNTGGGIGIDFHTNPFEIHSFYLITEEKK